MSAYLKYGCIHPRTLVADLAGEESESARRYTDELAWRDFYADVLWHRPESAREYLKPELQGMGYDSGPEAEALVRAWEQGRTGFPIVDAGMRQLLGEAYVHNRVRMIVASFLVKDLHQEWTLGARWFMQHLVDGDLASNNHGWQWVAGTGTDASPYYRVFNPITQGKKFDPDGAYVKRWVPELRDLDRKHVHEPWTAPGGIPRATRSRSSTTRTSARSRSTATPPSARADPQAGKLYLRFAPITRMHCFLCLAREKRAQAAVVSMPLTSAVAPGSCRAWSATAAATASVAAASKTLGMM